MGWNTFPTGLTPNHWASLIEIGESVIHVHQYSNGPVISDTKSKQ